MIDDPEDTKTDTEAGGAATSAANRERIAKRIARAGLGSRREAEAMIAERRVAVNGTVIDSPALDVSPDDAVTVDGTPLPKPERTRLWRYHKPAGRLVSRIDPHGRPTIYADLPPELARLISVGRLDFNSEGLLLLTNDGELSRRLELPSGGLLRRYRARAFGHVDQKALDRLANGITVEGVEYGPIEARLEEARGANAWIALSLREGKNREVRNVLAALGLQVNRLIRTHYGPFGLGDLPVGAVAEVPAATLLRELGLSPEKPKGWAKVKPRTNPMKTRKNQRPGRNARLARRAEAMGGEHRDESQRVERRAGDRFERRDPRDHRPGDRRPSGAMHRDRDRERDSGAGHDRGERRFGKPRSDERGSERREFRAREDRGERPPFKKRFDRPFDKAHSEQRGGEDQRSGERRFGKPRSDERGSERREFRAREERGERPPRRDNDNAPPRSARPFNKTRSEERGGGERRFEKRSFEKGGGRPPVKKRFDRGPSDERGERPPFKKRFDRPFDKARSEPHAGSERGERPPFKKRFEKRPFDKGRDRDGGERAPFRKREARPFDKTRSEERGARTHQGPREERGRAPFRKREGERRPFDKARSDERGGGRPYGGERTRGPRAERDRAERDRPDRERPDREGRGPGRGPRRGPRG